MRRRRFGVLGLGLALSASCSDATTPLFIDVSGFEQDLLHLAVLDEDERLQETLVLDLDALWSVAPRMNLTGRSRLVGLAFDVESLQRLVPRFDPSRVGELSFAGRDQSAGPCPEGRIDPDARFVQLPLPRDALVFEIDLSDGQVRTVDLDTGWFGRVDWRIPVRADQCSGHPKLGLVPFTSPPRPISLGDRVAGAEFTAESLRLRYFARVEDDIILAYYSDFVVVLERGRAFEDAPGRAIRTIPGGEFRAFAVEATVTSTLGRRVIVSEYNHTNTEATWLSRVLEYRFLDGRLGSGRTLWETSSAIDGLSFDPDSSRLVIFRRPSHIHIETSPGADIVESFELPDARQDAERRGHLRDSGIASHPLALVGTHRGGLFVGNTSGPEWLPLADGLNIGFTHRGFTTVFDPASKQTQLWAGNTAGELYRMGSSDRAWSAQPLRLDPRLISAQCAGAAERDRCGFAFPQFSWESLVGLPIPSERGLVVGLMTLCSILVVMDDTGCGSHFRFDGEDSLGRTPEDEMQFGSISRGYLTVASKLGSIFELPLAELMKP